MLDEAVWLLVKRDLYYRPNNYGYTGIRDHAGRYTEAEAKAHAGDGSSGVSMILESDAPEYTRACFADLRDEHARSKAANVDEGRMVDTLDRLSPLIAFKNFRRICKRRYQRSPNWVLAMEIFGLGSTYAYGFCRLHGIDPEGKKA